MQSVFAVLRKMTNTHRGITSIHGDRSYFKGSCGHKTVIYFDEDFNSWARGNHKFNRN